MFPKNHPPQHPDRLQVYSLGTPNGVKAVVAAEELGLSYELHRVDIGSGQQHEPSYLAINPNNKIPALLDPSGPGGAPLPIMESGAILLYMAEKAGDTALAPADPRGRSELLQWMFFQVGSVGPMFGQYGHFYKFAKGKTDTYGEERYAKESNRILGVLDRRLEGREWLLGGYTLADIMTAPWVRSLHWYGIHDLIEIDAFANVSAWSARFQERAAVKRAMARLG